MNASGSKSLAASRTATGCTSWSRSACLTCFPSSLKSTRSIRCELVLLAEGGVAEHAEAVQGVPRGRFPDGDRAFEPGCQVVQDSPQAINVRGRQLVGGGHVVDLDEHTLLALQLPANLRVNRHQGIRDVLAAVSSADQRHSGARRRLRNRHRGNRDVGRLRPQVSSRQRCPPNAAGQEVPPGKIQSHRICPQRRIAAISGSPGMP